MRALLTAAQTAPSGLDSKTASQDVKWGGRERVEEGEAGGEGACLHKASSPQASPDEKQELLAKRVWSKHRKACLLLMSPAKESSLAQQGPHEVLIQQVL